jgi:hypothetical protein
MSMQESNKNAAQQRIFGPNKQLSENTKTKILIWFMVFYHYKNLKPHKQT